MSGAVQTKSTKIMQIILWVAVGLTILTGILAFMAGGGDTGANNDNTFQSDEANPFK